MWSVIKAVPEEWSFIYGGVLWPILGFFATLAPPSGIRLFSQDAL